VRVCVNENGEGKFFVIFLLQIVYIFRVFAGTKGILCIFFGFVSSSSHSFVAVDSMPVY